MYEIVSTNYTPINTEYQDRMFMWSCFCLIVAILCMIQIFILAEYLEPPSSLWEHLPHVALFNDRWKEGGFDPKETHCIFFLCSSWVFSVSLISSLALLTQSTRRSEDFDTYLARKDPHSMTLSQLNRHASGGFGSMTLKYIEVEDESAPPFRRFLMYPMVILSIPNMFLLIPETFILIGGIFTNYIVILSLIGCLTISLTGSGICCALFSLLRYIADISVDNQSTQSEMETSCHTEAPLANHMKNSSPKTEDIPLSASAVAPQKQKIVAQCPVCSRRYRLSIEAIGRNAKCKCGNIFLVSATNGTLP